MKSKFKLVFALVASASILASCGPKGETKITRYPTDPTSFGTLPEGYTALDNKNPNPDYNADGNYTIGGQTIHAKNSYNTTFSTEPDDWDYLHNSWQYNSLHYVQMVDGLIMNDAHGVTYGGLAQGYKVTDNADGTETWSFKLKEGIKWYRNDTHEEYGEVVADDFVAGLEHVLDPKVASDLSYLPCMFIVGAQDYLAAASNDKADDDLPFSTVGVKAPSKYVVEYTLMSPTPYWLTNLTYGCYYPVSRAFLTEEGTAFGASANDILVNGAYFLKSHTAESSSEFELNPHYYDLNHVYFDRMKFQYVGSSADSTQARKLYEAGTIDGFNVQSSDAEGYKKYVTGADGSGDANNPADPNCSAVASTDQFSFLGYFNYLRTYYQYPSDNNVHKTETDEEKTKKVKAFLNNDFRKGFLYGLNVMKYLPYYNNFDPVQRLNRAYTVKGLAVDSDGKDYVSYVEDEFNKEQGTSGVKLVGTEISEDASAKGGEKGTDPIYDGAKSKSYFDKARAELIAQGVITADDVIYVDVLGEQDATSAAFQKAMYDSIEVSSGGWVKCNILKPSSDEQNKLWGTTNHNYDFSMFMGWGADYGDPQSFLHTMVGESFDETGKLTDMGDTLSYLGFTNATTSEAVKKAVSYTGFDSERALSDYLFSDYTKLYEEGLQYNTTATYKDRLSAFAKAEYNLIYESALIVPWYTRSGMYDTVSKVVPHMAAQANYGLNSDKYLNFIVSDTPITKTTREAINKAYQG